MLTVYAKENLFHETYQDIIIDPNSDFILDKVLLTIIELKNSPTIFSKCMKILEVDIKENVSTELGRKGMPLFTRFCLYLIKKTLNLTYDFLRDLVLNHKAVRQLIEINTKYGTSLDKELTSGFSKTALKENLSLISSDSVDKINEIIVKFGINKISDYKATKCDIKTDSSVVQTNIEFPTDTGLLMDAMEVLFRMLNQLSAESGCETFRQSKKILKNLKKLIRSLHQTKNADKRKSIAKELICLAKNYADRAQIINDGITNDNLVVLKNRLQTFINYVFKFTDQIQRRVINGELIPHAEKVFSVFKPHTEWIVKGNAGVICELGIKVLISSNQYNLIVGHEIMQNKQDVDVIVDHVKDILKNQHITSISCDKGFHSKDNQKTLSELVETVVIPQKGKLSQERKEHESDPKFINIRKQHAEIESNISGLCSMGYAKCRDVSLEKFKTHVSMTIVARNLWSIGTFLLKKFKKSTS